MNEITIRQATESDKDQINSLWEELSAYYLSLNPVFPIRWCEVDTKTDRLKRLGLVFSDPDQVGFVALSNDRLIGFIRAHITPHDDAGASLHTLVVRPNERNAGIGKALMSVAMTWCKERGASDVSLDVLPTNVNAEHFHRSLGFEPYITKYVKRLD